MQTLIMCHSGYCKECIKDEWPDGKEYIKDEWSEHPVNVVNAWWRYILLHYTESTLNW